MGKQGRKFKLYSSCLLLAFTGLIIYYGETTVKHVKEDLEDWEEERLMKRMIVLNITKEYNLKKALLMRDIFWGAIMGESNKYHAQALGELSQDAQNSLIHILKEERIWNALVLASFRIRMSNRTRSDDDIISRDQWDDTIELFTLAENHADIEKAVTDQTNIYKQLLNAKDNQYIRLNEYFIGFKEFNKLLSQKLLGNANIAEQIGAKKPIAELLFKYFAFEVSIYNDCHRKTQEGDKNQDILVDNNDNDNNNDGCGRGFRPLLEYSMEDEYRWSVIGDCLFSILDKNSDKTVTYLEIDNVLLDLEFDDRSVKKFQQALTEIYARNDAKSISHDDFLIVMERLRQILNRYQQEQNASEGYDFDKKY